MLRQRRQRGECHLLVLNGRRFLWTLQNIGDCNDYDGNVVVVVFVAI